MSRDEEFDGNETRLEFPDDDTVPQLDDDEDGPGGSGVPIEDAATRFGGTLDQEDTADGATQFNPISGAEDSPTAIQPLGAASAPKTASQSSGISPTRAANRAAQGMQALPTTGEVVLDGRYRFDAEMDVLGKGGMGTVYKAVDLQLEGSRSQNVAIKVLNPELAKRAKAVGALKREANQTRQLSHENIAKVYTFDQDRETNLIFMVMELLDGTELDDFMKYKENKDGVGKTLAFQIVRDLGEGLAYAHEKGMVHSDFKPGNAFLTRTGKEDQPYQAKVIDFGIARASSNPEDQTRERVAEGLKLGGGHETFWDPAADMAMTPRYASYEMFEGMEPKPDDDVYALALVTYQLLTGVHPYNRHTARDVSNALREKRTKELREDGMIPARPKGLSNREWKALRKGMAIHRADRHANARAFIDDLMGERTNPWPLAVVGLVAVLALGGVGYQQFLAPQPTAGETTVVLGGSAEDAVAQTTLRNARAAVGALAEVDFGDARDREDYLDALQSWEAARGTRLLLTEPLPDGAANGEAIRALRTRLGYGFGVARDGEVFRAVAGPFQAGDQERQEALAELKASLDAAGVGYREENEDGAIAGARQQLARGYAGVVEARLASAAAALDAAQGSGDEQQKRDRLQALAGGGALGQARALLAEAGNRGIELPNAAALREQASALETRRSERITALAQVLDQQAEVTAQANQLRSQMLADFECGTGLSAASVRRGVGRLNELRQRYSGYLSQSAADTQLNNLRTCIRFIEDSQLFETLRSAFNTARPGRIEVIPPRSQVEGPYQSLLSGIQGAGSVDAFTEAAANVQIQTQNLSGDDLASLVAAIVEKAAGFLDAGQLGAADLAAIRPPGDWPQFDRLQANLAPQRDECADPGLVGAGQQFRCSDPMVAGEGPDVVVVPGVGGGTPFGIMRFEITNAEFRAFCQSSGQCSAGLAGGDGNWPVTSASIDQIRSYASWLSQQTGRVYRLPTEAEWRHAADAGGSEIDGNRNCFGTIDGVSRGESLQGVSLGGLNSANNWGLRQHIGNAREWAEASGGQLVALGGSHRDPFRECNLDSRVTHDGQRDGVTGARLVREVR